MIEDLFKNNKLEYIHILTSQEYNIVKSMTISFNIQNLRYLYIYICDRVDLTLDITNEYP